MGTILSFSRDTGQWTASERSRLEALTKQVLGGGEDLHVVYGQTDDGAPWCAVMNDDDEVLVHVARVADQFLVHFVGEDVFAQGANLREALGQWLSPDLDRTGVVVPFNRVNGAEMAILAAIAAVLENQLRLAASPVFGDAGPDDHPSDAGAPSASDAIMAPEQAADGEATTAAKDDDAPAADAPVPQAATPSTPADVADAEAILPQTLGSSEPVAIAEGDSESPPAAAAVPAVLALLIHGGDGDDLLVGGSEAEHLVGGPGDDTLIGGGGHDTLDGGGGDDRIVLTSEAVAYGGAGADTFVITAPAVLGDAATLLGTILDFSAGEGDRVVVAQADHLARPHPEELQIAIALMNDKGDRRVDVDVNGDGKVDGYVLLTAGSAHGDAAPVEHAVPHHDETGLF